MFRYGLVPGRAARRNAGTRPHPRRIARTPNLFPKEERRWKSPTSSYSPSWEWWG